MPLPENLHAPRREIIGLKAYVSHPREPCRLKGVSRRHRRKRRAQLTWALRRGQEKACGQVSAPERAGHGQPGQGGQRVRLAQRAGDAWGRGRPDEATRGTGIEGRARPGPGDARPHGCQRRSLPALLAADGRPSRGTLASAAYGGCMCLHRTHLYIQAPRAEAVGPCTDGACRPDARLAALSAATFGALTSSSVSLLPDNAALSMKAPPRAAGGARKRRSWLGALLPAVPLVAALRAASGEQRYLHVLREPFGVRRAGAARP